MSVVVGASWTEGANKHSALVPASETSGRPNNVIRPGWPNTTRRSIPVAVTSSTAIVNARNTPVSSRRLGRGAGLTVLSPCGIDPAEAERNRSLPTAQRR
jgi:hypothetical protein